MAPTNSRLDKGSRSTVRDNEETEPPSSEEEMDEHNKQTETGDSDEDASGKGPKELKLGVLWFENNYVVRAVTKSIEKHFEHPCTYWTNAADDEKILWWNIFKTRFTWDPKREDDVHVEFEKTAARCLRDMVYKAMTKKN